MASENNQVRDASASQISVDAEDQFIYGIAQELNKKGIWNKQLPRHEYMIVEAALKSVQAWKEFFEITLDLESKNKNNNSTNAKAANKNTNSKKKRPKKSSTSSSKKRTTTKKGQKKDDEPELDNEKSNDAPVAEEKTDKTEDDDAGRYVEILKFRVRSIVFDHVASKHLFDSQSTEDHNPADDIFVTYDELLDDEDNVSRVSVRTVTDTAQLMQEDDEDDEDVEPVPAFKMEIAGNKVPQEKKNVNANRELRSLMPDVKQSTTKKWELTSSEELKDLYAGLERVLHELKNYKEHSYPFLKKVSKSEAPDYHEVISNPMDLATMTKNLHNLHYWSKTEFQSDLDLMYANCRKYNTEPEGKMFLEHADAMEKRTAELMKTVKEVDLSADKERLLEEVKKREGQREERKSEDVPNKRRTEVKQRIQFYHEHPFVTHQKSAQKSAQDSLELPSAAQLAEVQHKDYVELLLSGVDALELAAPEEDADLSKMLQRITAQHQQLFNRADPAIRPGKLDPVLNEQGTELEHVSAALNDELSKQIVKQSIAVILNQNNIGGCEHQALDVLTDVLEDFMLHIGRVARSYLDLPGSDMNSLDASVKAVSDLAGECTDGIREWLLEKKRDESRALREALIEEGSRQALHREMTPFIAFTRKSKPAPQLSNHHIGFYQHQQQAQQTLQQQQQQAQNQLQQLQQQQAQMQQTQGLTQHQLLQLQMQQRTRMQQPPQMHPQMQGAQVKKEGMPPQGGPQRFPPNGPPDMSNPHGAPRINSFPPNLPHNPAGAPGADNALRRSAKRRKGEGGEPIPVGPTITTPDTDARRVRPTRGRRSYPEEDYLDDSQLRHLDEMDKPGHVAPEMPAHHIPASYPPHAAGPEMMQQNMNAMYQPPPGAQVPVGRGRGAPPMNRPVPITNPPMPQPVAMPPQPIPEEDPNAKRGKRTPRGRGKK